MAAVVGPVAAQVGLQLVLQPYSNTLGHIAWECSTAVGIVYPAYASFKAVEILRLRHEHEEAEKWLTYWAVYGSLTAVERLLDKLLPWVPYYATIKLALLLWLQLPRYAGARRLSNQFVRPFLRQVHPTIDAMLALLRQSVMRTETTSLAAAFNDALAHIPLLEWFVRGPDGRPHRSSRPPSDRGNFITSR